MNNITMTQHDAAAQAMVALLPSATPVTAARAGAPVPAQSTLEAVTASFVGAVSADVSVALLDPAALSGPAQNGKPVVSLHNILRPALESAAGTLGPGVLGESHTEDAGTLFTDEETVVFELTAGAAMIGWFAVRIRENGVLNTPGVSALERGAISSKLGRINNVEMALTVEIGRTRMSVRDVLNLEPGGVVELDRSAGAPADILLNGRIIAHGEVVVIDQDYAVRITKILDIADGLS